MDFIFHDEGVVMTVGVMSRDSGVTLIEMLVAVSIMAILLAVGIPGMQDYFSRNRLDSAAGEFMGSLAFARSEAIRRGGRVTVCKSASPFAASPSCTTGTDDWKLGWIIFADNAHLSGNTAGVIDLGTTPPDTVLQVHGALTGDASLNGGTNFGRGVSYLSTGVSQGITSSGSTGFANGSFALCQSTQGKTITVNKTGRAYTQSITCP